VEKIKEEVEGVKLDDAEVVVAGGRGIGSKQNFEMVRALAHVLGGAVGASRPACDEGWTPAALQVGQSGKVVSLKCTSQSESPAQWRISPAVWGLNALWR